MVVEKYLVGRPSEFRNTEKGFYDFQERTSDYIKQMQSGTEHPNVETWSNYIGVSRQTLHNYKNRDKKWSDYIENITVTLKLSRKELIKH